MFADILTSIYFNLIEEGDKVVLSKGHAAPALYAVLAEKGFFSKDELPNLRKLGSILQGHPSSRYTPGVDVSSGSLGQGLSVANGIALSFKLDKNEEIIVTLGAGEPLGKIAQILLKSSIEGFEFASGIPGTIGGAIRMNAGAYGGEFKDIVESVTYMEETGEIKTIKNKECEFEYRHSLFSNKNYIIIQTTLRLKKGNAKEIKAKMDEYAKSRKAKQPITMPSAGSTFKRGEDFITAKLIDECGLKGYSIGDAEVSDLHAGFIVNKGNATASDILKLIEYIKNEVYKKFNKKIELEIEVLGE